MNFRAKKHYRRLKREGKCTRCGEDCTDYKGRCNSCRERDTANARRRAGHNPWRPGGRGGRPKKI